MKNTDKAIWRKIKAYLFYDFNVVRYTSTSEFDLVNI